MLVLLEGSLKVVSSEKLFWWPREKVCRIPSTVDTPGITNDDFRRKRKESLVQETSVSGCSTSSPLETASLPSSRFPSSGTGVSSGAVGAHGEVEFQATPVMFLLHCGLDTLGGGAGNLSIICKNVSVEKSAPSANTWLSRELWEQVEWLFHASGVT